MTIVTVVAVGMQVAVPVVVVVPVGLFPAAVDTVVAVVPPVVTVVAAIEVTVAVVIGVPAGSAPIPAISGVETRSHVVAIVKVPVRAVGGVGCTPTGHRRVDLLGKILLTAANQLIVTGITLLLGVAQ
jgi:hypothetical protein